MRTNINRILSFFPLALLLAIGCHEPDSSIAERPAVQPASPAEAQEEGAETAEELPEVLAEPAAVDPPSSPIDPITGDEVAMLSTAVDAFAVDLYAKIRTRSGNLVFSPASISLAFGMTWAGAAGNTASEIAQVMHFPGPEFHQSAERQLARWSDTSRRHVTLRVVDRLFADRAYPFVPAYLDLVRQRYRAPVDLVDFRHAGEATLGRINGWVSEQTEGRIADLLPPGAITNETRLVLVNAVYFLGQWSHRFQRSMTGVAAFHAPGGTVRPRTMVQEETFGYARTDEATILEMPYRGRLAMTVILPKEREGLGALEANLDATRLRAYLAAPRRRKVEVHLPRFTIEGARVDLGSVLPAMGIHDAFSRADADFSGMGRPPDPLDRLRISAAVHAAFIEVDEEGTEATAATAVAIRNLRDSSPVDEPRPPVFRADHPFLFVIRDLESGVILFMGRVVDPS